MVKKTGLLLLLFTLTTLSAFGWEADEITLEKDFLYDTYTLDDSYDYKKGTRQFQWDKIRERIAYLENAQRFNSAWGILQNKRNNNGTAPIARNSVINEYDNYSDAYGTERNQSIPLFTAGDLQTPERYGRDGSLIRVFADSAGYVKINTVAFEGEWYTEDKYIRRVEAHEFNKAIVIDITNQNIATLEKVMDGSWKVRSMNPATTGLRRPPFQFATPVGMFVVQQQTLQMLFYKDGTQTIAGFAPYASRFTNGAYIHGVPVNYPRTEEIEYSQTLGTTPRSHMCVRNATSHAKFVYEWLDMEATIVFVIE